MHTLQRHNNDFLIYSMHVTMVHNLYEHQPIEIDDQHFFEHFSVDRHQKS
jgi:hypothetical protein